MLGYNIASTSTYGPTGWSGAEKSVGGFTYSSFVGAKKRAIFIGFLIFSCIFDYSTKNKIYVKYKRNFHRENTAFGN